MNSMKNNIVITFRIEKSVRRLPLWMNLKKCIEATLEAEGVPVPCEINVLVAVDTVLEDGKNHRSLK